MRLDQFLVLKKNFRSRTQAKTFIVRGSVEVRVSKQEGWRKITKPHYDCSEDTEVRVLDQEDFVWVARSGKKLEGALEHLGLNVKGKICLDLGQSTGGFTQCLLERSVEKVVGVDIGHSQLAPELQSHPKVVFFEGVDARELDFLKADWKFDLVVADLSFISILKVLPSLFDLNLSGAEALLLIKPQFEVGREHVGKGGLVESSELQIGCQNSIFNALKEWPVEVLDYFPSEVKGKNGNQEFFCCLRFN